MVNRQGMVRMLVEATGWPEAFAREYVMERSYHAVTHDSALEAAFDSVYVSDADKCVVRGMLEG